MDKIGSDSPKLNFTNIFNVYNSEDLGQKLSPSHTRPGPPSASESVWPGLKTSETLSNRPSLGCQAHQAATKSCGHGGGAPPAAAAGVMARLNSGRRTGS